MEKLRYGVMGTGRIVDRFVSAVRTSSEGEIYAICSRTEESARRKASELHITTWYGSYEELVEDPEVDVVYVPTINFMHREHALLALRHGKHVVVEKPMTLSRKDTEELFEEAEKRGRFIMEAQKSLFLPVTQKVKEWLEDGKIGKLNLMEYDIFVPDVSFQWFYHRDKGGGALLGSGNYIFSHAMYLEKSDLVELKGQAVLGDEVDLQCTFLMKFDDEVLASCKISTMAKGESRCVLYGAEGKIFIKDFWKAREALLIYRSGEVEKIEFPEPFEMVYEVDHINACIRQGLLQSPVMNKEMSMSCAHYTDLLYEDYYR
ncbi:Gfo/Idh/MocA family protein [Proteiniclasticum ruminis]|uniref:Gfo/Idh/MocA family protein n=1 Tax=Proteiniclasticum ruminis TaxID=398199 RepID=UPI00289C354B|nr:Gfo/Idh/MocA family oxidoreductase [Proteiniclasticum ruminis]